MSERSSAGRGEKAGARPPIACEWPADQLRRRREELLPGLVERATAREALPDGFRWTFEPEPGLLHRIAGVVDRERSCCRFLSFRLEVEPDGGAVRLDVTGPEGTVAFLSQAIGA